MKESVVLFHIVNGLHGDMASQEQPGRLHSSPVATVGVGALERFFWQQPKPIQPFGPGCCGSDAHVQLHSGPHACLQRDLGFRDVK